MRDSGYYGIGIERGKTEFNYWTLFRTAQILDAAFLFVIGEKYKRHPADSMWSYREMPIFAYADIEDFKTHRPYDCVLVGIEITDDAIEVSKFQHPKRAMYILGSEDNGLSRAARDICQHVIRLYGKRSMNVAVAGSIVVYDRIVKQSTKEFDNEYTNQNVRNDFRNIS